MKHICPNSCCKSKSIIKKGFFKRSSDYRKVQIYKCKTCGKKFSDATRSPCYGQNKRQFNSWILILLCCGVSRNRIAYLLHLHRSTVQQKIKFLGEQCKLKNEKIVAKLGPVNEVQFDDIETFEHTKLKPVSISLTVERSTRTILGVMVSQMPAKGRNAVISEEKYGHRKDGRRRAILKLLRNIRPYLAKGVHFESDMASWYPNALKRAYSKVNMHNSEQDKLIYKHTTYKGRKSKPYGLGELKEGEYDPLFPVNHTAAMLRANINRLFRRTWCTTKKLEYLVHHLNIYAYYHNTELIEQPA